MKLTTELKPQDKRGKLPADESTIFVNTYTPEGQELLSKFRDFQEKPTYVRAHHLLCTGNCHGFYKWGSTNAYLEDEAGYPIYNWTFVDLTLRFCNTMANPLSRSVLCRKI